MASRRAHNQEVVGSNSAPATKNLQLGGLTAFELFCKGIGSFIGLNAAQDPA